MKLIFKQYAVRLGGWVRPDHARACFAVVVIVSSVYSRTLLAQTDNPPPAAVPPMPAETSNPPTLPPPEAVPTNNPPAAHPPTVETNSPPVAAAPVTSATATNVANLPEVTVYGKLDQARSQILPDLGATVYSVSKVQIESQSQGDNAPFSQVILRAPGVAQDSEASGDLHVRGEHANVQYRINDVLLPEGITGFGQELSPRFVDSLHLITGSLPAQYGFRTAGVVDIHTKSGAFEPGGVATIYGGRYESVSPSL